MKFLPSISNNNENILSWVDDQVLTEKVIIKDVKNNKEWRLLSLDDHVKRNDMHSKMSYDYLRNSFAKTGDSFMYSKKQDQERDEWIIKLVDDINMDLKDQDRQNVSIRKAPHRAKL